MAVASCRTPLLCRAPAADGFLGFWYLGELSAAQVSQEGNRPGALGRGCSEYSCVAMTTSRT